MVVTYRAGRVKSAMRGWCAAIAFVVATGSVPAASADDAKPDWPAVEAAMLAGDYASAAAAAEAIATSVRPKPRDPDYLPRSVALIRALMRGGVAALRIGRLDEADDAFNDAFKVFKDKEFQRLLTLQARQATATVKGQLAQLEVSWMELLSLRMTVILDRMRAVNRAQGQGGDVPADQLTADVARWMEQFAVLKRLSAEARESFGERFGDGGPTLAASPSAGALVGRFSPAMIAGRLAAEQSRMPAAAAPPAPAAPDAKAIAADAGTAETRRLALLAEALEQFQAAAVAYEALLAAAAPKAGALKPEARIEAAGLEVELLANRGAALFDKGDVDAARTDFNRALQVQRELLTLRKAPAVDTHPDLLGPLLAVADVAIADSRRRAGEGDADGARGDLVEAEKNLALAAAIAVPEGHPLQGLRAVITARLDTQQRALERSIPQTERTDMAARRLRRAINATAAGDGL